MEVPRRTLVEHVGYHYKGISMNTGNDPLALEILGNTSLGGTLGANWKALSAETTNKNYRRIVACGNITSYSQLSTLHECPRAFQLMKADAISEGASNGDSDATQTNVDFAFGHSVGAGVQTLLATGNLTAALFAAFVSWKADYFADNTNEKRKTPTKSIFLAQIAVESFHAMQIADEWELYTFGDGTPGVEISFAVDMENGYQHYGHIDLVLRNRRTGKLAIGEIKTTGFASVDEAVYANSSQALSYGVILDAIAPGQNDYEVFYFVYSATAKEWQVLPFTKSLTQKASWIQDILLDHSAIDTYRKLEFFPQRGESCINRYGRRCKYFGICSITGHARKLPDIDKGTYAEDVKFRFTRSELIQSQRRIIEIVEEV